MYQEHFGFERRPFGAVPDIGLFVDNDSNRECMDDAMLCLESGQGIAILTAPAGLGKTIVCHKLAASLTTPFVTVLLANSNFSSARAMLQSFLFELGRKYVRLEEQELRLELITALRAYCARDEKVVLIIDEAEHLTAEILEEIRNLANLSDSGQPLVRVVLSGQPQLEERLLDPDMTALNQRIRSQLYLQPLTRGESVNYVSDQIQICGQIAELVIQDEAMNLLVHAADGNPRCLNQLADHSLLLAYMSGERPVSYKTVRDALDDLKRLPLQWNDPGTLANDEDSDDEFLSDEFPVDNDIEQRLNQQVVETRHDGNDEPEVEQFAGSVNLHSNTYDDDGEMGSFEVGGETEQPSTAVTDSYENDDRPEDSHDADINDSITPPAEHSPTVELTASIDDDQTACFEVGAETHHEADDDDEGDIIELPEDEDSYVAYETTANSPVASNQQQGIASAFTDAEEFSDTYELNLSDEPGESELDIPLVPLGSSIVEAPISDASAQDEDGPTLSLVDRLSEDDGMLRDEDGDDSTERMEVQEEFAAQAIDSPPEDIHEDTHEEVVFDRYALLDAGRQPTDIVAELPADFDDDVSDSEPEHDETQSAQPAEIATADEEQSEEAPEEYDVIMADPPADELEPSIAVSFVGDLSADLLDEEREMLGLSIDDEVYDIVHPPGFECGESTDSYSDEVVTSVAMQSATIDDERDSGPTADSEPDEISEQQDDDRTYANLFSRLRRLQLAARDMDDRQQ